MMPIKPIARNMLNLITCDSRNAGFKVMSGLIGVLLKGVQMKKLKDVDNVKKRDQVDKRGKELTIGTTLR